MISIAKLGDVRPSHQHQSQKLDHDSGKDKRGPGRGSREHIHRGRHDEQARWKEKQPRRFHRFIKYHTPGKPDQFQEAGEARFA